MNTNEIEAEINRLKAENAKLKAEAIQPVVVAKTVPLPAVKDYDEKVKLIEKSMKPIPIASLTASLLNKGCYTPETKAKPVGNNVAVKASNYEALLEKFPEQYRLKLRAYTGEELYYVYRICTYKPRLEKIKLKVDGTNTTHSVDVLSSSGDALILGLKARVFKWLKGEIRSGVNISILNQVGRKFKADFLEYVIESLTQEVIDNFGKAVNSKRITG